MEVADALSVILRAASLVLVLQASGTAMFLVLFARDLGSLRERLSSSAVALCAIGVVLAQYALEAARLSGELSGVFDPALQRMVLASPTALVAALRTGALVLVIVSLRRAGRMQRVLAFAGGAIVVASFALVGHTTVHRARAALAALLMVHVALVTFWLGALVPLYRLSMREALPVIGRIVQRFSRIALGLVPLIPFAGVGLAYALIEDVRTLTQPYGLILIGKLSAFGVLMGLASANKWRLGPALSRGEAQALQPFRRSVAAEYVIIVCVLAATAVLTAFFSP
jgi:copper resistance protein D